MEEDLVEYSPLIPISLFPVIAILFSVMGAVYTAFFFMNFLTRKEGEEKVSTDILSAAAATLLLTIGIVYMFNWTGIYL